MQTIGNFLSIAQAAEELQISRQRMHVLIDKYDAKTVEINSRLKMISTQELNRIKKIRKKELGK